MYSQTQENSTTCMHTDMKLGLPTNCNYCISKLLKDCLKNLKLQSHSFAYILAQIKKYSFLLNIASLLTPAVINLVCNSFAN